MLKIVIPMAGRGNRFAVAGYGLPKPLIRVHGMPMVRLVIANLRPRLPHRFVFVCQREHIAAHKLLDHFEAWAPGAAVITLDSLTEGAACTVLAAKALIDNGDPLVIANSDQYVEADLTSYIDELAAQHLDGMIMTMPSRDPKWSYVATGPGGLVTQVTEKVVISETATVGIYAFRRGHDFVRATEAMVSANERVNGEFYVAPVYNRLIAAGARIGVYDIGAGMHGLGTPADLCEFQALPLARHVVETLE
jgi:NDP-sugar pyrophosphorylase family protein